MDRIKDNEEPPEDYWKDYEDEDEDIDSLTPDFCPRELASEISIKDLCDGREVMFQTGKELLDTLDDNEIVSDIPHCDLKSLRENRGAPPLDRSFKEIASTMTNLSEDGLVKKKIISSGVGKVVPEHAYVTVHYNLYKESCELPFDSTYLRNRPEKFKLGHCEAILGLEKAVKSMKKNENSIFFIKWQLAFGAMGCPDRIEGKCDIIADITLMNFMDLQSGEALSVLPEEDLKNIEFGKFINQTKKLICNGSDEFLKGEVKNAAANYRKAIKILSSIRLANEEQESIMLQHKVKCLVNLAICYNKLGQHERACCACQEALSIDNKNIKANFHYGRACIALSNFTTAQRVLLKANRLKPNDKEINNEIKKLNDKKALYEVKDKLFWQKAFAGEESKEKNLEHKDVSFLENFEKELISGLDESLKAKQPYILSQGLSEDELKICRKIAEGRNVDMETTPHFTVFKFKSKNDHRSE